MEQPLASHICVLSFRQIRARVAAHGCGERVGDVAEWSLSSGANLREAANQRARNQATEEEHAGDATCQRETWIKADQEPAAPVNDRVLSTGVGGRDGLRRRPAGRDSKRKAKRTACRRPRSEQPKRAAPGCGESNSTSSRRRRGTCFQEQILEDERAGGWTAVQIRMWRAGARCTLHDAGPGQPREGEATLVPGVWRSHACTHTQARAACEVGGHCSVDKSVVQISSVSVHEQLQEGATTS